MLSKSQTTKRGSNKHNTQVEGDKFRFLEILNIENRLNLNYPTNVVFVCLRKSVEEKPQ